MKSNNFLSFYQRGDYSVECMIYLLCMKVLAPDHVFLLRGNHETRELQKEFTFCKELQARFGPSADYAFKMFNAVFDVMPLAAIVDEQIFCSHGGIPSTSTSLEQLALIPPLLKDPNLVTNACELLWNDPITDREYKELLANKPELAVVNNVRLPDGFLYNIKRNSGCLFNETAVERFLSASGLSHIIRAHECVPGNFRFLAYL